MNYILAAYTDKAFQEFILPQIDNANYAITLDRSIFRFEEDIAVRFEVVSGVWRFTGLSDDKLLQEKCLGLGESLAQGSVIKLRQGGAWVSILIMEHEPRLDGLVKYRLRLPCRIKIGQAADNHIRYNFNAMVSQHHAVLEADENGCVIRDTSTNGIFMGSRRMAGSQRLVFGETVNILGLQLIWLGDILAVGSPNCPVEVDCPEMTPYTPPAPPECGAERGEKPPKQFFRRSPRNLTKLHAETVEIEGPPQPARTLKKPLLLTIGPSLTMAIPMALGAVIAIYSSRLSGSSASVYMYTGIIIAVAAAILGTIWALVNLRYARRQEREAEANRLERYRKYLEDIRSELREKHEQNAATMLAAYPSAADCAEYGESSPQLWNRNLSHPDFLFVRLGSGNVPFQCPISVPKKKFALYDDELAEQPQAIRDEYSVLKDVPVGIDLMSRRLVGVVGGADVMRTMAVQIAAGNCYTDVKMVFLYDGRTQRGENAWRFAHWFPHTWSEDRGVHFIAADRNEMSEVCFALTNVFRNRSERLAETAQALRFRPHYVVFVERAEFLEGEPLARYLFDREKDYGVTTVILAGRYEDLPNACADIIQNDGAFQGLFCTSDRDDEKQAVSFDGVSGARAEGFARRLADIEVSETESGGEVPDSLTFLDMYGVKRLADLNVANRWRKNRTYDTMRVLIGQKAGGAGWYLDIHEKYHGPHGLVAGTTGSGKSETLQTYILSLAVNYSPEDIAFFLIDFKGGGMANLFSGLPHMAGQISNLSGNQVRRAMVSIKSENRRRQRLFGEYGVNHIDGYTKLYKNREALVPIPHLFIIIDEFAELKREEPEFMRELISVAQVGRSLGVHLILATQKPSGTVDDNIWSNAKFRLCLRVQDRQDSGDMLHKPDAAYITQAGRGYMQVGNDEIYELFQSGWSGADYEEETEDAGRELAGMFTNTGKSALVGNHWKMKKKEQRRAFWLETLGACAEHALREIKETFSPSDAAAMKKVLSDVYAGLRSRGVDYPESRANSARLEGFVAAWAACEGTGTERAAAAAEYMQARGMQMPELRGKTQLSALVEHLSRLAKLSGCENSFRLWLPVLPELLHLQELPGWAKNSFQRAAWPAPGGEWSLEAAVGLADNPANQAQLPLRISLSEGGHLAVCGAVVSGKSTFLQTFLFSLVNRYTPDELNIYALDFSSRVLGCFEGLAHVGGVLCEEDTDRTGKLFTMLSGILDQRKQLMRGGNYAQYVRAGGRDVPAVVIAVDNYANFREKTANKFEDALISLSREGAGYGMFLVIASGGFGVSEIPTRIAENLRNTVCLEMGDKFHYGDILRTLHFDVLPETGVRGRGLAPLGGKILEFQTAVALPAGDDYERSERMAERFGAMNKAWKGKRARPIPSIPEKPVWSAFSELETVRELADSPRYLPFAYHLADATVCSIDLADTYCWLIAGRAKTGKTNVLHLLMSSAKRKGARICVVDFEANRLRSAAAEASADYIDTADALFDWLKGLVIEFKRRNARKRELMEQGLDDAAVFAEMSKEAPICILIDDMAAFIRTVYQPPEGVGNMSGFLENVVEKGSLHHIYFFVCVDTGDMPSLLGRRVYDRMAAYRRGIFLGGNVAAQRLFDFSAMPYLEQSRSMKTGLGLLPPSEDEQEIRRVVIPYARG